MWIQWVMTVLSGCSARLVFLAIVRHPPSADPELEDLVARRFNHVNRTSHSGVEGVHQPQDLQRLGGFSTGSPISASSTGPLTPLSSRGEKFQLLAGTAANEPILPSLMRT